MHRHLLAAVIILSLSAFSVSATELEPRTIGPTAGNVSFVSSAFSGGKFLTVWRQLFMPTVGIWGAFSDAAGKPLGPSFAIVPSTNAQYLNLFPSGSGFVLVWDDANRSSQLCQIDGNGRVTGQRTIGPSGLTRAYAMPGRIVFSRSDGSTIVDFEGRPIRELAERAFIAAGHNSFFAVTTTADLMLTRYSGDGQSLQQWLLKPDFCHTLSTCWFVAAVRELDSGSILVVVASNDHRIETLILAPDGSVSAPVVITMPLLVLSRASVQQSGTHLWLFLAGVQDGGTARIEATELDNKGMALGPVMTVIDSLPETEQVVFAEGAGLVFAATSPTTAGRQVQTFVFRTLFAPLGPEIISTTASIQADAQIASNGSDFLAAWKDTDGTRGSRWHWAPVDAAGRPSGAVLEGDIAIVRKSLVSNGLDYLMLLVSSNGLIARRLDFDGSILGDTPIFGSFVNLSGAAAVATANGYVIVWSADYTMYSVTLTSTGVAGPLRVLAPSVPSLPGRNLRFWLSPVLAWDGSAILLTAVYEQDIVFVQTGADTTQTPYAMLLTSDGVLQGGSETPLDPAFIAPSAAASSGTEFLVAGSEIALVHHNGTKLQVTYPIHNSLNAGVVWSGSAYAIARLVQGTAMVTLVARDGSILGTTFRRGPEDLDVAADAAGRLVISGVESDGRGPLRAVAYSGSELQPLPIGRSRAAGH
ncbi:MAG TPA: hypothetical protein VNN25_11610 [Thermoanaerobaculia bacterium]|nr:hypothetical protein [Thermoanaerobaculia bacterium]